MKKLLLPLLCLGFIACGDDICSHQAGTSTPYADYDGNVPTSVSCNQIGSIEKSGYIFGQNGMGFFDPDQPQGDLATPRNNNL